MKFIKKLLGILRDFCEISFMKTLSNWSLQYYLFIKTVHDNYRILRDLAKKVNMSSSLIVIKKKTVPRRV